MAVEEVILVVGPNDKNDLVQGHEDEADIVVRPVDEVGLVLVVMDRSSSLLDIRPLPDNNCLHRKCYGAC